jgi:hypothetical protein
MNTSLKNILVVGAAAASLMTATAQAKISSSSELRGYEACVEAASPEFKGLKLSRVYYLNEGSDKNTYYLNGSAWQAGERVDVRISCDTSSNGYDLLSQTSNVGSYALDNAADPVQVAQQ